MQRLRAQVVAHTVALGHPTSSSGLLGHWAHTRYHTYTQAKHSQNKCNCKRERLTSGRSSWQRMTGSSSLSWHKKVTREQSPHNTKRGRGYKRPCRLAGCMRVSSAPQPLPFYAFPFPRNVYLYSTCNSESTVSSTSPLAGHWDFHLTSTVLLLNSAIVRDSF